MEQVVIGQNEDPDPHCAVLGKQQCFLTFKKVVIEKDAKAVEQVVIGQNEDPDPHCAVLGKRQCFLTFKKVVTKVKVNYHHFNNHFVPPWPV